MPHLPVAPQLRREELTVGYRAPAQILEFASRLLPLSAPSVRPTTSVRVGRVGPSIVTVPEEALATEGLAAALTLVDEGFLVGLIVPESQAANELAALSRRDSRVGRLDDHGISRPITMVPPVSAKGLEFDAVVVIEPATIAGESPTT